ncbi:MAG: VWA domain-containing protein [Spirochaetes bacterium]|nr:VWA domain-containing protein [Spirochaetota bacterium]
MILENPAMLLLMPVVVFIIWFSYKRKNRGAVLFSAPDKNYIKKHKPTQKFNKERILPGVINFFFWLSLILIVFSFSAPKNVTKNIRYLSGGNDFFIVLDVSPSMAVIENGRTRLDIAKEVAEHIVMNSGNDYPGLILFGSNSVVSVLPTPDRNTFFQRLRDANVMDLGDATAIGTAIGTAIYFLRDSPQEGRSIILISDGGENYGELTPIDAAHIAARAGIRINCIAIGSPTSEVVIIDLPHRDRIAGRIIGSYDPALLRKIAEITRGYFLENPTKETIRRITASFRAEREEVATETFFTKRDLSGYFFIPAVFILLLAMSLKIALLREIMP